MIGPLGEYMTLGILLPAAFPDSVDCAAAALAALQTIAADAFFGAVEVSIPASAACRAREILSTRELVVDVDAGGDLYRLGASLCSLDAGCRQQALHIAREAIDTARALGARQVSLVSGRDPGAADRARAQDVLTESLLDLCVHARARGVELALKMADRAVDKCFLIGPTSGGVTVARRVRDLYPDFGLILNLAHLPLLREDHDAAARQAAPYLSRVDIGNCVPARGDSHPRFGVPGSEIGVPELTRFLSTLVSVEYLSRKVPNVVAFEIRPALDENPLEVIAQSKQVLMDAWAHV